MINKIGYMCLIPVNFKAEIIKNQQSEYTQPKYNSENKGVDTLILSNFAMTENYAKKDNFEIKPISLILSSADDINKIGGEKIYTSDGKLHSIIKRDESTITIFTPDSKDENNFPAIEVYDKSNRLIKTQTSYIMDGKKESVLREFDAETGKELRYTLYVDSKPYNTMTTIYEKDGRTRYAEYCYADNSYHISVDSPKDKSHMYIVMNKNKQIREISSDIEKGNTSNSSCIYFYNGTPYQIVKNQTINIPNTINIDFSNDEELKPAEYITRPKNLKDIKGEKTYYSNGDIETNCFDSKKGKVTAYFLPGGICDKISFENKEITFYKNTQTIKETIGEDIKTTYYNNSKLEWCKLVSKGLYKEVYFHDNGKIYSYEEGRIKDNDEEEYTKIYNYDKNGVLTWAREYDY